MYINGGKPTMTGSLRVQDPKTCRADKRLGLYVVGEQGERWEKTKQTSELYFLFPLLGLQKH